MQIQDFWGTTRMYYCLKTGGVKHFAFFDCPLGCRAAFFWPWACHGAHRLTRSFSKRHWLKPSWPWMRGRWGLVDAEYSIFLYTVICYNLLYIYMF